MLTVKAVLNAAGVTDAQVRAALPALTVRDGAGRTRPAAVMVGNCLVPIGSTPLSAVRAVATAVRAGYGDELEGYNTLVQMFRTTA